MQPTLTPEFLAVLEFLDKHPNIDDWDTALTPQPRAIDRVTSNNAESSLLAEGSPVCVTDGLAGCQAMHKWTFEWFKSNCGNIVVKANDRAPARHADYLSGGGRPQQTLELTIKDYINQHIDQLPDTLNKLKTTTSTPFYLNGWRAFSDMPSLKADCPPPLFAEELDHTVQLLIALDKQLFGASGNTDHTWCINVDTKLSKLFIGPPGTVTRLHFDAGEAHGYLGQIQGRKLFVLFQPGEKTSECLYQLGSEKETQQSPVDPLAPDLEMYPKYSSLQPMSIILHPGEVLIIPKGWWHYAVALDKSITLQRNFYNAQSNASGLVNMVLKTAATMKRTA